MARFRGSLAHQLDFEDLTTSLMAPLGFAGQPIQRTELRLAPGGRRLRGPDKYRVLEHRRRRAQIEARRALGLF
jgi:hypothetical protein